MQSNDISTAKGMLMKVNKNNRKLFVGIEPRMGNIENNALVVMHESMVTEGKDGIRNEYRNTFCV